MNTVNVIDVGSFDPFQVDALKSFPETPEGNDDAEELFRAWVMDSIDNHDTRSLPEIMQAALDDGIFTDGEGGIVILHST